MKPRLSFAELDFAVRTGRGGRPLEGRHVTVSHPRSGSSALAIWGDPIVGKALVLLLRGSGYKAKFVPALPSSKPPSLKDTQLLVLTPTPQLSAEERTSLLTALLGDAAGATKLSVLELVTPSQKTPEELMRSESWYSLTWPCGLEELAQRVEGILSRHLRARGESAEGPSD
jgi:hypothetical protein